MSLANDMTALLKKISRRLGMTALEPHLPKEMQLSGWAKVIEEDTMVTFSRYFPNRLKMIINDETTYKKKEHGLTWYYIKDEVLQGTKLLGVMDIDWIDNTAANASLGATSLGGGYYYPSFACPEATLESILALQLNADMSSLYNRGVYIDYEYPNRFCVRGLANTDYDLKSFVVILLVQHRDISTISPTKMEIFERLAQADIARSLYMNLRYYDNLETAYLNIDLKLSELQEEAGKRDQVIEELQNSYVTPANDNIPYLWTV